MRSEKPTMATIRLKHVVADVDRHGNVRYYYRIKGKPKIRLRGRPGSEEFSNAYATAERGETSVPTLKKVENPPTSFASLCEGYYRSHFFTKLNTSTQQVRKRTLERYCAQYGTLPFKMLKTVHVRRQRNKLAHTPEAATGLVKALRHAFKYALEEELVESNPARDVPYLHKEGSEGFHTWTPEELAQYEAYWFVGSKPRLAMALLLYTGQRRSDVVRLGRQHEKNGELHYRQVKTGQEMVTPILAELRHIIDASPCGDLTYLVTKFGKPFSAKGFGVRFREWCDKAGLPKCSAHGLRKAAATSAAEKGATEAQLKAIFGWKSSSEVDRYIRKARQKKLAANAQHLVVPERLMCGEGLQPDLKKDKSQ